MPDPSVDISLVPPPGGIGEIPVAPILTSLRFLSTFLDPTQPGQIQRFSDILEYTHTYELTNKARDWGYLNPNRIPRRTSDSSAVNNSTTLVNDSTLKVSIGASRSYWFYGVVLYNTSAVADLKLAFTVPAGASLIWAGIGYHLSTAAGVAFNYASGSGTTMSFGGVGANTCCFILGTGTISATQGDLQLQFAQDTAEATNTVLLSGSWLKVNLY